MQVDRLIVLRRLIVVVVLHRSDRRRVDAGEQVVPDADRVSQAALVAIETERRGQIGGLPPREVVNQAE